MAELAPDASAEERVRRLEATKCYSALLVSRTNAHARTGRRLTTCAVFGCCRSLRTAPGSTSIAIGRCTRTLIRPRSQGSKGPPHASRQRATANASRCCPTTRFLDRRRARRTGKEEQEPRRGRQQKRMTMQRSGTC